MAAMQEMSTSLLTTLLAKQSLGKVKEVGSGVCGEQTRMSKARSMVCPLRKVRQLTCLNDHQSATAAYNGVTFRLH